MWLAWRQALGGMTLPEHGLVEAALVLLGGVLLVTPGVMTDLVGIVFILPWSRRWIAGHVRSAIDRRLATGAMRVAVVGSDARESVARRRALARPWKRRERWSSARLPNADGALQGPGRATDPSRIPRSRP